MKNAPTKTRNIALALLSAIMLAASVLPSQARDFTPAWKCDFDMCIEKKCSDFTEMARDNAGSEEGTQQALVGGVCLATCGTIVKTCKIKQKMKQKFCLGKSCDH